MVGYLSSFRWCVDEAGRGDAMMEVHEVVLLKNRVLDTLDRE